MAAAQWQIDLFSGATQVLMNPRLEESVKNKISLALSQIETARGCIWFSTSGSERQKWVALTTDAIFSSAAAVNMHLNCTANDSWLNPLPFFHVGGAGIYARAHLSKSMVYVLNRWAPRDFIALISDKRITLTALVPAQIYDLVLLNMESPPSLRAVIVGGGALSPELYLKARLLGWPLLPSYGLTECASQVATATLESLRETAYPHLKLLPHIEAHVDSSARLYIKSPSLLTCYAFFDENGLEFNEPLQDGWLALEDFASLQDGNVVPLGRGTSFVKIGGESVSFVELEAVWQKICLTNGLGQEHVILPVEDDRLGFVIQAFTTEKEQIYDAVEQFNQSVLPFARIRSIHQVDHIPRSALNKILKKDLLKLVLR